MFQWLQQQGNIEPLEMYRTFNCGIGMVVIVAPEHASQAEELLKQSGETVCRIGHIRQQKAGEAPTIVTE